MKPSETSVDTAAGPGEASGHETMVTRDQCPSCRSPSLVTVHREPYSSPAIQAYLRRQYAGKDTSAIHGGDYVLARCSACGLAFQQQVPDSRLLRVLYEDWVSDATLESSRGDWCLDDYRYLAGQVEFVVEHFGTAPNRIKVLDFGFGWAQFSKMAMGFGCEVSGAELSAIRIDHARSVGIRIVDLDDLPCQEFHFINTEQVFEHLIEPRVVLERLVSSLAPDGLLKISVPDAAASLGRLGRRRSFGALSPEEQMPIAPLEHVNCFNHDSLVAFGRELGLTALHPRLSHLFNSESGLMHPRNLARTLLRPLYRHALSRGTFVYFVRG